MAYAFSLIRIRKVFLVFLQCLKTLAHLFDRCTSIKQSLNATEYGDKFPRCILSQNISTKAFSDVIDVCN